MPNQYVIEAKGISLNKYEIRSQLNPPNGAMDKIYSDAITCKPKITDGYPIFSFEYCPQINIENPQYSATNKQSAIFASIPKTSNQSNAKKAAINQIKDVENTACDSAYLLIDLIQINNPMRTNTQFCSSAPPREIRYPARSDTETILI